ncbi:MAG TPA: hypothetical protein PL076_08965 [Bacillota bacterium]|nr:hypothetical protein [Bacillota bacterium]
MRIFLKIAADPAMCRSAAAKSGGAAPERPAQKALNWHLHNGPLRRGSRQASSEIDSTGTNPQSRTLQR